MKIWKNWKFILPVIFALGLSIVWSNRYSFVKFRHMRAFFKNSPAELIKQHEKLILEDREILAQYDLFYPSSGSKDAGPFLNPMIHWQIGEIHHQGSLTLPEFVHKEMNEDWVTKKPLFKKMGLKFGWMKELLNYDVWSPDENSPVYPPGKRYQTYAFPVPNYKDLVTWAKLRYLYGKETGDAQSALKEVRHLMRLIWTNDYLVSSMVVVNMLKMENQFEEILTPKEMGDWKFIPLDHVMRAKRHFYSLPALVDIRLSDEMFQKMQNTNAGLCLMLNEAMMGYIGMKDFLAEELKYGMNRFSKALAASNCRKTILHKIWADPKWETHTTLEGIKVFDQQVTFEQVKRNPALKATVGYILANVGGPMYFQYGKQ